MRKTTHPIAALCACLVLSGSALAQQAPAAPGTPAGTAGGLTLELNALKPVEAGCQVTFLAGSTLGAPLDRLTYEFAFFDASGSIDRLLAVDFKGLGAGKSKVIQFALDGLPCDNISRVLINNAAACEGAGVAPTACLDQLTTTTRPTVTFGV